MSESVLISRSESLTGDDLGSTAVSAMPLEALGTDLPQAGAILDERYEITGLLGQGGMGVVLSARHVVLGQRLAVKVLRREMTRDAEIVERFRREARAASAIGHPGIVAVKDFGGLASGASYYVMEHVDGRSLADEISKSEPFAIGRAADIVSQIADALGAAHAAGVVHRDVKPENVLLTSFHGRPDHVKILDFGIAKLDFASRLSGAHRVLGTPAYMAPEQVRGQKLDHRADVYALGILLYELLTGDVPFDDPRPLEVLRQQMHVPAPTVQLLRPETPDAIAALVSSCLEKSPDARPASMKELVERLAPFVPTRVVSFAPGSMPAPAPSRPPLPSSSVTPVVVSRPTPVLAATAAPAPSTSRMALAAGVVLCVVGVAALAAAGGILIRERSFEREAALAAAAPVVPLPAPVIAAPTLAAAPPPVLAPAPTTVSIPSVTTPSTGTPPHPHAHPAHVVAAEPVAAPAPPPPPPPTTDAHPAIRVIDPWDQP